MSREQHQKRTTIKVQKPGHTTPNGKFIITVGKGIAKSIKLESLEPVSVSVRFGSYVTIDAMFGCSESAVKERGTWHKRVAQYDGNLGYPKMVTLDKSGALDDELYFEV